MAKTKKTKFPYVYRAVYPKEYIDGYIAKIVRKSEPFTADLRAPDFQLTTDLNDKSFAALRALLTAYRKERPAFLPAPSGR